VPVGQEGELCVRTRYLSMGYWGDQTATAARFVVNPATRDPGDRLYLTGDRARYRPDGAVEFRGRADDQVKVRGFRVELGEVATVIARQPAVDEAVALGRPSPDGDHQIVAFVTAKAGCTVTAAALASALAAALPAYAQPSSIAVLPQLPRLANGKVDRQALLALPPPAVAGGPAQAGNAHEREIAAIWSEVLGVPTVALDETFYDLGGDSLSAIRVMLRMRAAGVPAAIGRQILQGRTIAQIASARDDQPVDEHARRQARRRELVGMLRGLMVMLVVASHWVAGALRRVPGLGPSEALLAPLLNWPTPGFALVFGMGLGFVHLPLHRSNPQRARLLLLQGARYVGAGAILLTIDKYVLHSLGYGGSPFNYAHPLTLRVIDNVLVFYLLALTTAPLALRLFSRPAGVRWTLAVILLFEVAHHLIHSVLTDYDQLLAMWIISGKFAYFNLGAGALAGMIIGDRLRRSRPLPRVLAPAGAALMLAGALLSRRNGVFEVFATSYIIEPWKWAFYLGLTFLVLLAGERWGARLETPGRRIELAKRILIVCGQLALPLFLLDYLARDLGYVAEAVGSNALRFAIGLVVFFPPAFWMIRKAFRTQFGSAV
jgi:hypothetical protein